MIWRLPRDMLISIKYSMELKYTPTPSLELISPLSTPRLFCVWTGQGARAPRQRSIILIVLLMNMLPELCNTSKWSTRAALTTVVRRSKGRKLLVAFIIVHLFMWHPRCGHWTFSQDISVQNMAWPYSRHYKTHLHCLIFLPRFYPGVIMPSIHTVVRLGLD